MLIWRLPDCGTGGSAIGNRGKARHIRLKNFPIKDT